jgi:hypothetical protein
MPFNFFAKSKPSILFVLLSFLISHKALAQKDSVEKLVAFKITDYIKVLNDSSVAVQVLNPASFPVKIADKKLGVLYHAYKPGIVLDTAMIGWGRCNLIKSEYYYFGIRLQKKQQASEGDIIYLKTKVPYVYDGLLLNVMNHAIQFTNVYGDTFMNSNALFTNTKKDEQNILDSMLTDIQYTGNAMLQQIPEQNQMITDGIYKGKKLFAAMQIVKRNELELFLKYIIARPKNYAGNTWKISETFATWMVGGTPTVVEE